MTDWFPPETHPPAFRSEADSPVLGLIHSVAFVEEYVETTAPAESITEALNGRVVAAPVAFR